jgi:hypothetical protein
VSCTDAHIERIRAAIHAKVDGAEGPRCGTLDSLRRCRLANKCPMLQQTSLTWGEKIPPASIPFDSWWVSPKGQARYLMRMRVDQTGRLGHRNRACDLPRRIAGVAGPPPAPRPCPFLRACSPIGPQVEQTETRLL